jgi:hypothetical protein
VAGKEGIEVTRFLGHAESCKLPFMIWVRWGLVVTRGSSAEVGNHGACLDVGDAVHSDLVEWVSHPRWGGGCGGGVTCATCVVCPFAPLWRGALPEVRLKLL